MSSDVGSKIKKLMKEREQKEPDFWNGVAEEIGKLDGQLLALFLVIMASLEAQRFLEQIILDYMSKRGFHQTGEVFFREILANQNPDAINSPHEGFLQAWWGKFYEAYNSSFPDVPVFAAESFDKVAQTVENVVANNDPANQSYASDHTGANISNVMPSPHLMASSAVMESSGPHLKEAKLVDLLSSFDASYALPDLSPQRDMISGLQFPGYQMQQMLIVPPEWNARDDIPGINLGGPTQMEPNIHAPASALPASPKFSDAGNNRSFQQASHQGCPSVGVGSIPLVISDQVVHPSVIVPTKKVQFLRTTSFPQQDVLPNVAVQTLDPAPASSVDFFCKLTQADSSGKYAGMLGDTNRRMPENLPADQQIIAPIGGIMRSSGKQPAVRSGRKRKTPSSSLAPVGKEKATAVGLVSALTKSFAAPARTQAEREGISFKEICNLHATNKLLCCHFDSRGELLATAGHDKKVHIWELGNNNVNSGEGHTHHVTDVRFRPNSTVFATSSLDRTVKIWDAAKPSNPFQNLVEHAGKVMSIDFHPTMGGLLSSCDSNDEIRLWDVNNGDCKLILKRHVKDVRSICWDMSGNYMASVCEDSARIWSVSEGKCIHELHSSGNKFQSCTFHPRYAQVLVIGSDEFLELWKPISKSNITWPYTAHAGIISSLADSPPKGTIASVSHDQWIKIWE
ncbi:hypothetical protein RND71_008437 [Anisodus tanguticus]|uniref:Uncharacterized protein n=1 Tax=Anisodus tanguticus TaxID=243964 RepID=A0AAE1SP33_9SOLA|nr:hypothetical protein RND71_008437 [Anisodus tanguticus]